MRVLDASRDKTLPRLGPYRLVRRIGSGGMASVFEAVDDVTGQRVALKRLHPHLAEREGAAERFLREGRSVARLSHRHVVRVIALGDDAETPYLAMELLAGEDLGALLTRKGALDVAEALDHVLPIFAAIAAAHDAGIIHRDVKPPNIVVAADAAGEPCPKLVDFGISKQLSGPETRELTGSEAVLGTAAYMAPEQIRCVRDASFASDQYAIAVVLYQAVTGALPFAGRGVHEVFEAIMTAPFVAPNVLAPSVPAPVAAAIGRAMRRDPLRRFPSVRAFGAALLPFASERTQLALGDELEAVPESDALVAVSSDLAGMPLRDRTLMASMAGAKSREASRRTKRVWFLAAFSAVASVAGIAGAVATAVVRSSTPRPAAPSTVAHAAIPTATPATTASPTPTPPPTATQAGARVAAPTSGRRPHPARATPTPAPTPAAAIPIGDNGAPVLP